MHMATMLDYECLNCSWVKAHILDESTVVKKIWGLAFKSSLYLEKMGKLWRFFDLLHHIYGGHVGFRFAVVDGSFTLSYLISLLL